MRIICFEKEKERFLSNKVYKEEVLSNLQGYVDIKFVKIDSWQEGLNKIDLENSDYVLADIKSFQEEQFLLREKTGLPIKYVLILHSVWAWLPFLLRIIPLLRHTDVLISPSEYVKKSMHIICPELTVHVVPHFYDISKIHALSKEKKEKAFCFFSRIRQEKGIEQIIDIMPELVKKVPDVRLDIMAPLSGHFDTDQIKLKFVEELENKIKKKDLQAKIVFTGLISAEKKYTQLSKYTATILPTVYKEENLPMSIVESLACSTPVITSAWAGNREIIKHGNNGFLLEVTDQGSGNFHVDNKKMLEHLTMLFTNEKIASKMACNAFDSAQDFDIKKIGPKITNILTRNMNKQNKAVIAVDKIADKRTIDLKYIYNEKIWPMIELSPIFYTSYKDLIQAVSLGAKPLDKMTLEQKIRKEEELISKQQPQLPIIEKIKDLMFREICVKAMNGKPEK